MTGKIVDCVTLLCRSDIPVRPGRVEMSFCYQSAVTTSRSSCQPLQRVFTYLLIIRPSLRCCLSVHLSVQFGAI